MSQNWLERQVLAVRSGDQQVLDGVLIAAEGLLHAHDQVELALALDHLRGRGAAHRGFHQRVHVAHVQAVARQFGAVRSDGQAGLAQFPHHGDLGDARNLVEDVLHLVRLFFQRAQVRAEDLHRQGALQPRLGFVHRVFGRLRVVEDDARETPPASSARPRSVPAWCGWRPARTCREYGFRPTKNSLLKKPVGSVPSSGRPSSLATVVTCGKLEQDVADLRRELGRLFERNGVRRGGPHPQRAFIQVRHEFAADEGNQQQRAHEDRQNHGHRHQAIAQAPAQHPPVAVANPFVKRSRCGSCTCLRRK